MKTHPLLRVIYKSKTATRTLLALLVGLILVIFGLDGNLSASEWAAWFGAIGSIGAWIGTIWIATRESTRRHHDELQIARLHAAAFTFRLIRAVDQIEFLRGRLDDVFMDPHSWPDKHDIVVSTLTAIDLPSMTELVPMTALPNGVAAKLAAARGQIEHAIEFIRHLDQGVIAPEDANPSKFTLDLDALVERAQDLVCESIGEAQAARKALGLA